MTLISVKRNRTKIMMKCEDFKLIEIMTVNGNTLKFLVFDTRLV